MTTGRRFKEGLEWTNAYKARAEADKGTEPPKNLITWVFQDDFIPRAKLTEDGSYSIISDYLGTPVEAYDKVGKKVWERELDIYGRIKRSQKDRFGSTTELVGEDGFIPFRYQGQYEDVETGLYYNRFRYYSPSDGIYIQIDPIGLSGNNPTLYAYVFNPLSQIDPFGLINFKGLTNAELIEKIGELAYRDKRLFNNSGMHGVVHRIREQITGKMRPPNAGWYTHEEQIQAGLKNLREGLNEARTRGIADTINNQYPGINKVSTMDALKPTDKGVPKICR